MKTQLVILCSIFIWGISCNTQLKQSLSLAGENKAELEAVLNHFNNDTCKEKYEAVQFLIKNMPIHFSKTLILSEQQENSYNEISKIVQRCRKFPAKPDRPAFDSLINILPNGTGTEIELDCKEIDGEYLIRDIESAFSSYINNPFNASYTYQQFREFVLPYRVKDGILLHDWRSYLKDKYRAHFENYVHLPLQHAVRNIITTGKMRAWGYSFKGKLPFLQVLDFEIADNGNCSERVIYNRMILSAFGIPCATDLVPAWGNINSRHTWNVLLANDTIYPFDPFPSYDMWNLKYFYDNKGWNRKYGEFRLPKVFRETFSINLLDINKDSEVEQKNIPLLFKRYNYIDVSEQYFEPTDISVTVDDNIPSDVHYMYICVFQRGNWKPVWYGKFDSGKVTFKKMGKRIVYNVGYYRDNRIYTIGTPFYVNSTGLKESFEPDLKNHEKVLIKRPLSQYPEHVWFIKYLKNCQLQAGNDESWQSYDTLAIIPDSMLNAFNTYHISSGKKYKYLRFVFPKDSLMVGEIEIHGENKINLSSYLYNVSSGISKDDVQPLFDGSGYNECFIAVKNRRNIKQPNYITWKLDKAQKLKSFRYCPCIKSYFYDDMQYELLYWYNNKWLPVASRMPIQPTEGLAGKSPKSSRYIKYDNVPKNALLYLRQLDNNKYDSYSRIFIYKNGIQEWH